MKSQKAIFMLTVTLIIVSGLLFSVYVKSKISSIKGLRASISEFDKPGALVTEQDTAVKPKNLKIMFPESGGIVEFIENAYRISKRRGIYNFTFEQKNRELIELSSGRVLKTMPAAEQKLNVMYAYPIKISFNSSYRNMAEFTREMQNQERLVTVENLTVKREKELLSTHMVVNIYSTGDR